MVKQNSSISAWTCAAALVLGASSGLAASAAEKTSAGIPALTGPWQNANNFKLIPVPGSPKPVDDLEGYIHHERGVDANGNDVSTNAYIGDYKSPLLTAWGSATLKKLAEDAIQGKDPFWPATFCYPFGPTALLQPEPVLLLQEPDKVTIFYQRDHQVRHVYLNVPHSKNPKPSWYGESVGHYDGDTLVVDTIGFNDKTYIDRYGVPFSDQLHLIERYQAASDGKSMQVEITYDDPKTFTKQWKALSKYRLGRLLPEETACAESPIDPVTGEANPIPVAQKADF
ncbi:MAG TPA: hypothetical protein VNH44_01990 [Micropepsaceae bacterium]|nr:hypothetical protein [Micropepsaceae bacterium]